MCISLESVEYIKTLAEFVYLFGGVTYLGFHY